jgi:hypothetical protein
MRARRDVKENHFIRPLLVVAQSKLDRITHIAKFTSLGLSELHASRDLAVMHIQARYDAFSNHE